MTLPSALVAVWDSATPVADKPKTTPESPLGLLGPMSARWLPREFFPTWVSEYFLLQIEGLKLLDLRNHPLETREVGAGGSPLKKVSRNTNGRRSVCPAITESIPKLGRGDVVEWPDDERAKFGKRFRVENLPTLLRIDGRFQGARSSETRRIEFARADFCRLLTRC